jgi:ferredoxin
VTEAVSPRSGRIEAGTAGSAVVLLCSDVCEVGAHPVRADVLAAGLATRSPGARVFVVERLCSDPAEAAEAMSRLGMARAVIGCRHISVRGDALYQQLRRVGLHPAGTELVDLMPAMDSTPVVVTKQSIALLWAALARVERADIVSAVRKRHALGSAEVSRRGLLHAGSIGRLAVASFAKGLCNTQHCGACLEACPHGALSYEGEQVVVDATACTGCGACVSACRSGAMSLNGLSRFWLEAGAGALVAEARQSPGGSGCGVAIVCDASQASVPVGGNWLPLKVPSLEMVSAGWLLQMLSFGVGVKVMGCDDNTCVNRGRDLERFCAEVIGHAPGDLAGSSARGPVASERPAAAGGAVAPIRLCEPEATVEALVALSAPPTAAHEAAWRVESSVAPLGEITLDPAGCSACDRCVVACPTSALCATREGATMAFSFEASACFACGSCVSACPEGAVGLRRVVDSVSLEAGRRPIAQVALGSCCESCGRRLGGGLVLRIVGHRLATSHPEIAARLQDETLCTDCLLEARH